jgi:hypothetical protein
MDDQRGPFEELAVLLHDIQRDYAHWRQDQVVSQLRRTMPEYSRGIWDVAMPFNRDDSDLPDSYRERFAQLRQKAAAEEQLDLGHVLTSIDVHQSVDLIRDAYASWAGDLGTHVLANLARQTRASVGSPDSLADMADIHGDIDGDNIARHMPDGKAVSAILAYYQGDDALMDGATINSRYRTFAGDMGLLDDEGNFTGDRDRIRFILHNRTREFIILDDFDPDAGHALGILKALFDEESKAQISELLDSTLDQFLAIIASGVEAERREPDVSQETAGDQAQ